MFTNTGYQLYQAERPMTSAERNAVDTRNGMLAESVTRALRPLVRRHHRQDRHDGVRYEPRPAPATCGAQAAARP
jgi:hypothetical protein